MSLLKTAFTSAALLTGGLLASTPDTADAQVRIQFGSGGSRYNDGYYNGRNYYSGSRYYDSGSRYDRGWNDGWNRSSSRGRVWHDTSHYDYHPTTVVPHGDHYHVQPGHYDYHRTGHWH
jgi:hypothetical protein